MLKNNFFTKEFTREKEKIVMFDHTKEGMKG